MSLLFVLDPCFGPWIAYPLLALVAAGVLWDAAAHGLPERRLWRILIRLVLLVPLAIFLLRPTQMDAEENRIEPTVAVLFDVSKSLDLPTPGGPATHRRDVTEQLHAHSVVPVLSALPGHHEAWTINDSLHALSSAPEKITVWPNCGGGSALGDGLCDLVNGAAASRPGARCDAVILYSDGAITRGRGWTETLAQLQGTAAPVFVFAVGDPGDAGPPAYALDRLQGPDRINAGEEARFQATLRAPAVTDRTAKGVLRLHWKLDGVERAVHELPPPQNGALLNDEITLPFSTPGLARVSLEVEAPPTLPVVLPPQVSQLVAVEAKKIRLLFWSMRLSRQTRGLEEQLARDGVLSVNVAGDFFRARGLNLDNALRSADVLVWEDPDLARLAPATRELLESRLKEGVGLILLSSPRLELSKSAFLLSALPAQAGAPWVQADVKPVVPAELRTGGFFGDLLPPLPTFTGRLQQFETPHDLGGYQACITTAEGQPVLLAGHPAPGRSVVVLLTPDWPSDDETLARASAGGATTAALGVGSLIRQAVHWVASADVPRGDPAIHLKLSDDRPLPDQAVNGSIELTHVDANLVTTKSLQLVWLDQPPVTATAAASATADTPPPMPAPAPPPAPVGIGTVPPLKSTPIDWQLVNGQVRFRLSFDHPGAFLVQARFSAGSQTLTDQVGLYVPGEELERTEPPDHAHLQQLADVTGGRFVLASICQPDDLAALKAALTARLTPQPSVTVGRISLGGGGFTAALMIGLLLLEMILRSRRWW